MYLFFDTETTGRNPHTARLVQLAFIVADEGGKTTETYNEVIKPVGFSIPKQASAIHGITQKEALETGVECKEAVEALHSAIIRTNVVVCHNFGYDIKIIDNEIGHHCIFGKKMSGLKYICTMLGSMHFCNLPNPYGYDNPKYPRLSELHEKLFGCDFDNAHNALADVQATMKCFFELKRLGILKT